MTTLRSAAIAVLGGGALLVAAGLACSSPLDVGGGQDPVVWTRDTDFTARSQPYVDGDLAVFAGPDEVIAVEPGSGDVRWRHDVSLPPEARGRGILTVTRLLADEERVFVPAWNAVALDRETGEVQWRFAPGDDFPSFRGSALTDTCLVTTGRHLYCLDPATGRQIWRAELGGQPFDPLVADGVVYVGTRDTVGDTNVLGAGPVAAVDLASGEVLWSFPVPDAPDPEPWKGGVVGKGDTIGDLFVVAGQNARVYGLDRATGEPRWTYVGPEPYNGGVVIVDDVVVVGGDALFAEGIHVGNGDRVWTRDVRGSVHSITAGPGVALTTSIGGALRTLDPDGEAVAYSLPVGRGTDTGATYHDGRIYYGGVDHLTAVRFRRP